MGAVLMRHESMLIQESQFNWQIHEFKRLIGCQNAELRRRGKYSALIKE